MFTSTLIGLLSLSVIFAGAVTGSRLQKRLPDHLLSKEMEDLVKVGAGLIASMSALILGLVVASAKNSYDAEASAVQQSATDVLLLDRMLALYGPETNDIRIMVKQGLERRIALLWPEDPSATPQIETPGSQFPVETLLKAVRQLKTDTDDQKWYQSQALDFTMELIKTRWAAMAQLHSVQLPAPFLAVILVWLSLLFTSFGLFAPESRFALSVLFLSAFSVALSIFLIIELAEPFTGVVRISPAPLKYVLTQLGV